MAQHRVREWEGGLPSDADSFRRAIAEPCEPVVLRGLCKDWPATKAAADSVESLTDYLLRFDSGAVAQAFIGEPGITGR
jgi:hypothetical protein